VRNWQYLAEPFKAPVQRRQPREPYDEGEQNSQYNQLLPARDHTNDGRKNDSSIHGEDPEQENERACLHPQGLHGNEAKRGATKQSLFQAKIASLRSQ